MKKIILGLAFLTGSVLASAQCNGEFTINPNQPFQKFSNGAHIKMTYCGDKGNLHVIMNNASAYRDNLKLEVENDSKNEQLYTILVTIKENNSGQYAMKSLIALGVNEFYFEGKKIKTGDAESIFK